MVETADAQESREEEGENGRGGTKRSKEEVDGDGQPGTAHGKKAKTEESGAGEASDGAAAAKAAGAPARKGGEEETTFLHKNDGDEDDEKLTEGSGTVAEPRGPPSQDGSSEATSRDQMEIIVKMRSGSMTAIVKVDPSDTVGKVKTLVEGRLGIPSFQQCLIFAGKKMDDSRALSDYDVQPDSTIALMLDMGW